MANTRRNRAMAAATVMAVTAGLLVAPPPAWAEDIPAENAERSQVVMMWRAGGVLVAPEAERALLGDDNDVRAFLARVSQLQDVDDRVMVNQILSGGGEAVRIEAQRALDAGTLSEFLSAGWQRAVHIDQRVRVNQMMSAGGPLLRAAAQKALDADAASPPDVSEMDESPSGPLDTFIVSGWKAPLQTDQRLQVNQIMSRAPTGSNVRRLAQRALDAGTLEALTEFLDSGHAVGAARDEEASTITDLVQAAERAGVEAEQLNVTAKEEGAKATAAAAAARTSAQAALAAMRSAQGNVEKAASAARRAAEAAESAARAAAQAMAAAQAAVAASRIAARAASRAAAVAALTRRAANRANKAAADAAVNKNKSDAAKELAKAALNMVKLAKDAAAAVAKTEAVATEAIKVAQAAGAADKNADEAAAASQEALALARAAGVNVQQAEAAARRARNHAARANRAASASIAFAQAAVRAARSARLAANEAAEDATAAAKAAAAAAEHAGEATKAAEAATNAANAATKAADRAVTAANDAYEVYTAARAVDEERLAAAAEAGADAAKAGLTAYQQYQRKTAWDAQEAAKRDVETNRLIAEVRTPGIEQAIAVTRARRVALRLSTTGGPYTKQEALTALGGGDEDVLGFVRTGIDIAAAQDDRATLTTLAMTGTDGMRAAAEVALAGSDSEVAQFLREQDYAQRATEDRIAVNRVMDDARKADNPATVEQAQKALDSGPQALRAFLTTGQFTAAYADERVKANRLLNDEESGTELKAAAQNALDGPPGELHEFVTNGWYVAAQNDYDAQAHDSEMLALLQRAAAAAAAATEDANDAQAIAANARGKSEDAIRWAEKANEAAERAVGFANDARKSAEQAEKSADKAVASSRAAANAAKVANKAAESASRSAAAARESYRQAQAAASEASEAAKRARASAKAAGKNADEARGYYEDAFKHTNKIIDGERRQQRAARQQQYTSCLKDAGPDEQLIKECSRVLFDPDSAQLGKATLNKQFCNKFAQTDSTYYQTCVADAFNPNFMANRAMDLLMAGAMLLSEWGAFTMVGIGIGALTIGCAALCATAVGVLGGAEASMGVGGLYMAWAEGALIGYVTGGLSVSFAGGRLLNELRGSLGKIRIPAVFQRIVVPSKSVDANFVRLITKPTSCLTVRGNSFTAGTQVLMADGKRKVIEDVEVGDQVLATNEASGVTNSQPVTNLITGTGDRNFVDITVDTDGADGEAAGEVTATDNHPFWVADQGVWRNAADLRPGQWLRTSSGTWVQVSALRHWTDRTTVHNLTVAEHHTYYVLAGNAAVLVHNSNTCGIELTDLGAGWYESPNHLLYGPGSVHQHRILHVLDHAHPNPAKPSHTVFDPGGKGILELVDEAWLIRGTRTSIKHEGNRTVYVMIPMGRTIGTRGEKHITIIVRNGDEIITAYPQ